MSLDPALTRAKAAELGLTPGLAVEAAGADTASAYQHGIGLGLDSSSVDGPAFSADLFSSPLGLSGISGSDAARQLRLDEQALELLDADRVLIANDRAAVAAKLKIIMEQRSTRSRPRLRLQHP